MCIHNGSLMNGPMVLSGDRGLGEDHGAARHQYPPRHEHSEELRLAETAVAMAERLVRAGSKIVSFVDYDPLELVKTANWPGNASRRP